MTYLSQLKKFLPLLRPLAGLALVLFWAIAEGLYWLYRQINWTKVFHWTGLACWLMYQGVVRLCRWLHKSYEAQTTLSFTLPWPPVTRRHPALGFA